MNRSVKSTYFLDTRLVPRVQEYLDQNPQKKNVHIPLLAETLRRKYPEYNRKKIGPFIMSVQKAYQHIQTEINENWQNDECEALSPDVSGLSDLDEVEPEMKDDTAKTNSQIRDLYAKGQKQKVEEESELDEIMIIDPTSDSVPVAPSVETPRKTIVAKRAEVKVGQKRPHSLLEPETHQNDQKKKTVKTRKGGGFTPVISTVSFADIGGNDKTIHEVCKLLVHIRHPEVYKEIGVPFPKGILLHGPPGCGKTLFAHAIAGELKLPFFKVAATEVVSGVSGESEEKLRDLFEDTMAAAPSILFIDEIDSITPKRETAQREMERRIVAQLLACLDDLNQPDKPSVLVIGATNRPDALDPALRRAGRFDREIAIGIPDEKARIRILKVLCKNLKIQEDFDWLRLSRLTPGYVGADLMALAREAAMVAVNRVFERMEQESSVIGQEVSRDPRKLQENGEVNAESAKTVNDEDGSLSAVPESLLKLLKEDSEIPPEVLRALKVTFADFLSAVSFVQPSAQREGFATVPGVTWDDVGALKDVRTELQLTIMAPIQHPDHFAALGLTTPSGILLCGPPGCGKTLLAKAIANEAGVNFISVKGPELLNMYVGESERAVRQCFQRAQNSAPCVIFFDEIDALCPKRSGSSENNSSARVVNQLLTEMDGLNARKNVFLLAATNRPDILDPAALRPGRLDKTLFVGLPTPSDRIEILKALTKNGTRPCLEADVNLDAIAMDERCNRFTGADIAALTREAAIYALREAVLSLDSRGHLTSHDQLIKPENLAVARRHFDFAFQKIKPSVSEQEFQKYEELQKKFSLAPLAGNMKMDAE